MNKFAVLLASAAAFMGAQAANATTYSPTGPHTLVGTVAVQKSLGTYTCTLTINANVSASSATVTSAAFSGGFPCALIGVTIVNGTLTYTGPDLSVANVSVSAPLSGGTCDGSLTGVWDNATSTLTFSSPKSDIGTCKIVGSVKDAAGLSITNP